MNLRLGKVLKLNKFLLVLKANIRTIESEWGIWETAQFRKLKRSFCSCICVAKKSNTGPCSGISCFENAPKTSTTLHCRGQLLSSAPIRDSQVNPGLILGEVQHCQGFIMKHDRLWAGWMYMISVDTILISGKNCQREFLKPWRGLEGMS